MFSRDSDLCFSNGCVNLLPYLLFHVLIERICSLNEFHTQFKLSSICHVKYVQSHVLLYTFLFLCPLRKHFVLFCNLNNPNNTFSSWGVAKSWANMSFLTLSIGSRSCWYHEFITQINHSECPPLEEQNFFKWRHNCHPNLSYPCNLIPGAVRATRIWHRVPMVSIGVHLKNLKIRNE